ncbi:hypothetical protein ILUMI_02540 [Ignelater luminosus]|uniref:SAM-dependent MTase RsmB/NOP-type domain-containing protein n=1 Tax=Ignelater luminosus TaxID=2038154 RepID=A0A8K0DI26_IGNLU|nr:hypothetical protein ILUMI_02540 [Ignelater luminosus]
MPYPLSPFNENFKIEIILEPSNDEQINEIQVRKRNEVYLSILLKWLCTSPQVTSFRVNTLNYTTNEVQTRIADEIKKLLLKTAIKVQHDLIAPNIEIHSVLPEVILLHNLNKNWLSLETQLKEIVIDVNCAAAVLRGAHIFAPGVLGMESGINKEDKVSIYADLSGKCKKGLLKKYECLQKMFIGNGVVKMVRYELFGENLKPVGIAIEVTDTISHCPNIGEDFLENGSAILQNLPSIVCTHILNPKPGEVVLDMCASPGNKTTHIAALMQNMGTLIAIDKTPSKIQQLKNKCDELQANVHIFQADSTKIMNINETNSIVDILNGPPFHLEIFDRILLDAPCSGLGKRPQLSNNISEKVLRSYVPLQKKLFKNAVGLLKTNGRLVYSTCTITLAENEGMVAWALRTFNCLELIKVEPYLGGEGLEGAGLTELQRTFVQRFGPDQQIDSVGFFIACFIKK